MQFSLLLLAKARQGHRAKVPIGGAMAEFIDVFADAVHINVMAFGCTLQFALSKPVPMVNAPIPPGPVVPLPSERIATIRVTTEFLKGLTFLLREHILQYERTTGVKIELPPDYLASVLVGTSRERWNRLWE